MPAYLLGPTGLFPGLTTPAHKLETILVYGDGFGLPTSSLVEGSSSLFLANCKLRPTSSVLSVLIASGDARCGRSFRSFDRRLGPTGKTGRLPFGGCRVSEVRHQLLMLNRGRKRAPNLRAADRIIAALCARFMRPARVPRSAVVLKPSTLLHLHSLLRRRKYRLLFSPKRGRRPSPKGPKQELIEAVIALGLSANCPADRAGFRR